MPDVDFIRPCAVVALICFIKFWRCVVVSVIVVVCSIYLFLFMCPVVIFMNFLLKAFALYVGEVIVCVKNCVCENGVFSVYICWWLNVTEGSLNVYCEFVASLLLCECVSAGCSLYLVHLLIVVIMRVLS